jgi:hypothetical protein
MKKHATLFVGLDVHKDSISVAHVPDDRLAEVLYDGRIGTRLADVHRLVRRLEEKAERLVVAYEAGAGTCPAQTTEIEVEEAFTLSSVLCFRACCPLDVRGPPNAPHKRRAPPLLPLFGCARYRASASCGC